MLQVISEKYHFFNIKTVDTSLHFCRLLAFLASLALAIKIKQTVDLKEQELATENNFETV